MHCILNDDDNEKNPEDNPNSGEVNSVFFLNPVEYTKEWWLGFKIDQWVKQKVRF